MRLSTQPGVNATTRLNSEVVLLLIGMMAVVLLRLALRVIGFSQMTMTPEMTVPVNATYAMSAKSLEMTDRADHAILTQVNSASNPHCRDTMPGCDAVLQGVCSFSPAFVVSSCAAFAEPPQAHSALLPISADDLSPLGRAPKIPPRL